MMRVMARTPQDPESPARRFTDVAKEDVTVIPRGLKLSGQLTGAESLELGGLIEGPVSVEGLCHLHDTARVVGPVSAGDAVIEGEVEGPLTARGKVELRPTARVRGDIEAGSVALAEGCFFEGHIHMETAAGSAQPTSFQEKRAPRSGRS
jgi:cytoskeletal protein CcmA (bactofilin family)